MSVSRYGIAEWFGLPFESLTHSDKVSLSKAKLKSRACPFNSGTRCNKSGGVCSLRKYQAADAGIPIKAASDPVVSICPNRFLQQGEIYKWIGSELIGTESPRIASEIPFLLGSKEKDAELGKMEAVGRIDAVLVNPDLKPLEWCALEIQAVYFSGPSMSKEFDFIRKSGDSSVHWPQSIRRPDFRSSGPKRLMPQLQIKVPTISRWGKKMAVVVDRAFFQSLAPMAEVDYTSNADIIWFVIDYKEAETGIHLVRHRLVRTTLDRAVEGLTGGHPVSKEAFELALLKKLP